MNKKAFGAIIAVILCTVLVVIAVKTSNSSKDEKLVVPNSGAQNETETEDPKTGESVAKADKKEADLKRESLMYDPPESVPEQLEGFYEWPQTERLNKITEHMSERDLSPEIIDFYKREICNRAHWDVTRNNMANALVGQHNKDPKLYETFLMMLEDENEDPVWRDYCIQFLSECMEFSDDKDKIMAAIKKYSMDGKKDMGGTAIIHLAYQEGEGTVKLGEEYGERIAKQLDDEEVTLATKISILGVIGQRRDTRRIALVRKYADQNEVASLKRTAIGTLGLIGDESDIPLVKAALGHKNRGVVLAAKGALKRLTAKEKTADQ